MKTPIRIAAVLGLIFLASYTSVLGETRTDYTIQIQDNGSCTWIIRQTGSGIDPSYDLFISKVRIVIDAAENLTGRNMSARADSLKMAANISGSYTDVTYQFEWESFGEIEETSMVIGDVFEVENVFELLFGDGTVLVTYPSQYAVEAVNPTPREQNASLQTMEWYGTLDFAKGEPKITLKEKTTTSDFADLLWQNMITIVAVVALIVGSAAAFYTFRHKNSKKKEANIPKPAQDISLLGIENNEDKVLKLLKASGGTLHQSDIAEQCRFSKAKTSQLLAILENKGRIKRYKTGRDKVVVLQENEAT